MFETLEKQILVDGGSWTFTSESVRLPDGTDHEYYLLNHPGGVVVLAMRDDGMIALVRQYRYAIGQYSLEFPAGKRDKGQETPIESAKRELKEETGCDAACIVPLGDVYPSPGMVTEKLFLFAAKDLSQGQQQLDEDEFIQVQWKKPAEVRDMIKDGTIKDAKTICSFYLAIAKGFIVFS